MSALDEIRSRLSIEEVVAQYVPLKKVGRNYKGLCPFHHEKTPSFIVSPEKQLAYCFGCHKGGDLFTFVKEIEGVEFKEALTLLAEKAGVRLESYAPAISQKSATEKDEKQRFYEALEEACQFFERSLRDPESGRLALEYLKSRGLHDETIRDFRLGFSLDSFDALQNFLLERGFKKRELLLSGLVKTKDTTSEHTYDAFRGRLMFPILDVKGSVVAFGARALKSGDEPKYLNSPETPVYHKGSTLYGLSKAKEAIRAEGKVVFVEGYMDLIASHQAGIQHVVASSGTALTRDQLQLVKRWSENFVFAFDTDLAGLQAAERGIELAQLLDCNLRILHVPSAKDPAEFLQQSEGKEMWPRLIEEAKPYMDFCFERALSDVDLDSPEGVKRVQSLLFPIIQRIRNGLERDQAIKKLAAHLSTDPKFVYEALARFKNPVTFFRVEEKKNTSPSEAQPYAVYEYFFGLLYQFPEYFSTIQSLVTLEDFPLSFRDLYKIFGDYYTVHAVFDRDEFLCQFSEEDREKIRIFALKVEIQNEHLSKEHLKEEIYKVAHWIRQKSFVSRRKKMLGKIQQASSSEAKQETFLEYSSFLKEWTS